MVFPTIPPGTAGFSATPAEQAAGGSMATFILLAVLFVVLAVGSAVMMTMVLRRRQGKGIKQAPAVKDNEPAIKADMMRHAQEITNLAAQLMGTKLNAEQKGIAVNLIGEAHALIAAGGGKAETPVVPEPGQDDGHAPDLGGSGILLAVGNPAAGERLKELLNAANARVETAGSGQAAYKKFADYPVQYRMVLLGTDLTDMDGADTAWKMRKLKTAYVKSVPIIGITDGSEAQKVECIGAGMNDVLTETFSKKELYALVARHIRKA